MKTDTVSAQADARQTSVFRRRAFYIHGFDPRPVRLYHARYQEEAQKYNARFGTDLRVGPTEDVAPLRTRWMVQQGGVETEYEYLHWRDLVSRRMRRGLVAALIEAAIGLVFLIRRRYFSRLWRADRSFFGLAIYPYVAILIYALAGVGLGFLVTDLLSNVLGMLPGMSIAVGTVTGFAAFYATHRYDGKRYSFYLSYFFTYLTEEVMGRAPELAVRQAAFADIIAQAAASGDYDEVLVIGHSAGAIRAVEAVAGALSQLPTGPRLSLLTIGQITPSITALPEAVTQREAIHQVAGSDQVDWVDVSATRDPLCFALLDPTTGPEMPADRPKPGVKVVSAHFGRIFGPQTLRPVRLDFFERHFLYLYANDAPGQWDWFAVTAGPGPLAQRFANRKSSGQAERLLSA